MREKRKEKRRNGWDEQRRHGRGKSTPSGGLSVARCLIYMYVRTLSGGPKHG